MPRTAAPLLLTLALLTGCGGARTAVQDRGPRASPRSSSPAVGATPPAHSLTDPTSIWVVVDKRRPLEPPTYAPTDLTPVGHGQLMRREAAQQLLALLAAAQRDGLAMQAASGYRSYAFQLTVHQQAVASEGQAAADRASARAGYSEHQTGWAVDLAGDGCDIEACFGATPDGVWVAANAYRFGFVVRYQAGEEAVTGYEAEPWHLRYVGIDLATRMHDQHIPTLEQAFGLPAAPDYG